ncbi:MAG: hypothetical protein E7662_04175 [Ruminococcaceae bacterium]|nr:hypothetical protein [Oscillospiraceae bacterium]
MRFMKFAAVCAALAASLTLSCLAAAPVFSPRSPMADTTSTAPGGGADSSLMEGAESIVEDVLPGGDGEADSSLGDTNGDGVVESDTGTGAVESMMGADSESDQAGKDSAGGTDSETDTAQSSSGNADKDGMGVFGVILTVVIIGAAAALLFALWPKRRNG